MHAVPLTVTLFALMASGCYCYDLNHNFINATLRDLPGLVAFWPLTIDYNETDAKYTSKYNGVATASAAGFLTTGPFSNSANTAYQTSAGKTVSFTNAALDLQNTSWTFTLWHRGSSAGPLLEYSLPPSRGMHIWHNVVNNLFYSGMNPDSPIQLANCSFSTKWQFVAVTYNRPINTISYFCDNNYYSLTSNPGGVPRTSGKLFMGFREGTGTTTMNGKFACVSIYSTSLNIFELMRVKEACKAFTPVCPIVNCPSGSPCVAYEVCQCAPGLSGHSCGRAIINPSVIEGRLAQLPGLVSYWPLSIDYMARDAKAVDKIDGLLNREYRITTNNNGPYAISRTFYQAGDGIPKHYITFDNARLNLTGDFTIALWVRAGAPRTLFAWAHPSNPSPASGQFGMWLKRESSTNIGFYSIISAASTISCSITDTIWTFIGISFQATGNKLKLFCNDKFDATTFTTAGQPVASSKLHLGYNLGDDLPTESNFACFSIQTIALTTTGEMINLKETCRLFSSLCELVCQNGGACVGKDVCSCASGYTGANCRTRLTQAVYNEAQVNMLPNLVAYWPLSIDYNANDISSNKINGWFTVTGRKTPDWQSGPYGVAQTAATLTYGNYYIAFDDARLDFSSSFTWTTWLMTTVDSPMPLIEYTTPADSYGIHLWQYDAGNKFWVYDQGSGDFITCTFLNQWKFIALVYDLPSKTARLFCDSSFGSLNKTWASNANTEPRMYFGYRPGEARNTSARYACASAHDAALTAAQLLQVKETCSLFSAICNPVCANGGTCVGTNKCSCATGWTGNNCGFSTAVDSANTAALSALPNVVAYWPLSLDYSANDAGSNHVDGYLSNYNMKYVSGPFGSPYTAMALDPTSSYPSWDSPLLEFGNSSWTLTSYVHLLTSDSMALWEYTQANDDRGAHLWQWDHSSPFDNSLWFNQLAGTGGMQMKPCVMINVWQFVGVIYDHTSNSVKLFCNDTMSASSPSFSTLAETTNRLALGKRFQTNAERANALFACGSIHSAALSTAEMLAVKDRCRNYAKLCSPACSNGGSCVGNNLCSCASGWTGFRCGTSTIQMSYIQARIASLPYVNSYWPLTSDFRVNDAKSLSPINGDFSNPSQWAFYADGPYDVPETSVLNAYSLPLDQYPIISSPNINFVAKSWTWTILFKGGAASWPIWEYATVSAHLWHHPSTNQLWFNGMAGYTFQATCNMKDTWTFVALTFDNATKTLKAFCHDSWVYNMTMPDVAFTNTVAIGQRAGHPITYSTRYACASTHSGALNSTELLLVKDTCAIFALSCTPSCLNGGACIGFNLCNCSAGWTGLRCGTALTQMTKILTTISSLPNLVAYWPLSADFEARDSRSSNPVNGKFSVPTMTYAAGPFGLANAAIQSDSSGQKRYVIINSPNININGTSMTLTMFTKVATGAHPLFEYYDAAVDFYRMHVWHWTSPFVDNWLQFYTGSQNLNTECTMLDTWQFVASTWHKPSNQLKNFCDASFSSDVTITSSPPITTQTAYIGYRRTATFDNIANANFACVSLHNAALNESQLLEIKKACRLFEVICNTNCSNGGTCIGADLCGCTASWTDDLCDTPVCSPACLNGGSCIAPNNCTCTSEWEGSYCQKPICDPVCGNGGSCVAPNNCTCAFGYQGTICDQFKCVPSCPSGLTCSGPNMCTGSANVSLCTTVKTDISPVCQIWKDEGQCLSNPAFMWVSCQESCTKYATCECAVPAAYPVDMNCTCGDWASSGLCETDIDVRTNCSYTCGRRLNPSFSCTPEPEGLTLPANSHWVLTDSPPPSFGGRAGFMQAAIIICDWGFSSTDAAATGMHVCDPFSPNPASGNWVMKNPELPTCKPGSCPPPPVVAGATYVNFTTENYFKRDDIVRYSCKSGLVMSGTDIPEAYCSFHPPTGWTWNDTMPSCNLPPCKAVPQGVNAYFNISSNQTGGVATYSCYQGYSPDIDTLYFIKTCQSDGTWLPADVPLCSIVRCGFPPEEDHSYMNGTKPMGGYVYGDQVTTFCTKGAVSLYVEPGTESTPLSSVTNQCLETGFWSTNLLSCLLVKCNAPQPFEIESYRVMNSSADLQNLLYGTIVAYECDWSQGYEPTANQTVPIAYWRCNENSTWEKQPLSCVQNALLKAPKPVRVVTFETINAVATATTVLSICAFFMAIVVCLDYMTLTRDLRRLRHNWNHLMKWIRDKNRAKVLHDLRARLRNTQAKERYLKKLEDQKEAQQLATAGYNLDNGGFIVNNPLERQTRPLSGNRSSNQHDHVEGEMDLPEDATLRLGLADDTKV